MRRTMLNIPCPRCGSKDTTHARNYGRPDKERGWCMACGSLWMLKSAANKKKPEVGQHN